MDSYHGFGKIQTPEQTAGIKKAKEEQLELVRIVLENERLKKEDAAKPKVKKK